MPVHGRPVPPLPSLRRLRLEAKRRVREGEFAALHQAQLIIAREHGTSSWAGLKHQLDQVPRAEGRALGHLRWAIDRFAGAAEPGWTVPNDDELGCHFSAQFLERIPPEELVATILDMGDDLRRPLTVLEDRPLECRVQMAGIEITAGTEPEPPHRLLGVRRTPLGARIVDPRVRRPPWSIDGAPPPAAVRLATAAVDRAGLPGLLLAGAHRGAAPWVVAVGRADLARGRELATTSRFPALAATAVVTVGAVLRLAADGRLDLDDPANEHLRTVSLADAEVTVRHLLSHTGGLDLATDPAGTVARPLVEVAGPVIACGGDRGVRRFSAAGLAVLGQLVADLTGQPYPVAAGRLVLEPLEMGSSGFPATADEAGSDCLTGYHVGLDGHFEPVEPRVATLAPAGGLWSTASDLVRLGTGWSALLPPSLAREATTAREGGERRARRRRGLGWMVERTGGRLAVAGGAFGVSLCLRVDPRRRLAALAVANRPLPLDDLVGELLDAGAPTKEDDA